MSDAKGTRSTVAERWSLPAVEGPIVGMRRDTRARDAENTRAGEAARKAEMDRGYEAGLSAGRAGSSMRIDEFWNPALIPASLILRTSSS